MIREYVSTLRYMYIVPPVYISCKYSSPNFARRHIDIYLWLRNESVTDRNRERFIIEHNILSGCDAVSNGK